MSGALALVEDRQLKKVWDMPILGRRVFGGLITAITNDDVDEAVVEEVTSFGMGRASAFTFGHACGVVDGSLSANKVPILHVKPQVWRRELHLATRPKDNAFNKEASRAKAVELWPAMSDQFLRKQDHNRAEAALIALWWWCR